MAAHAITADEFETHVQPMASENWATEHGHYAETDAEWAEMLDWAQALRVSYETGELEITWR
jgi:hypothetical protein